ncbi:hypothetical protein EJ07DRAFT_143746 [Lizonia empirigonia]|nr:hypothetical protein EJ07DRAFT_143746 [Lizonia empirigonia]
MDVISANERFSLNVDGTITFSHTQVIYRLEGRYYSAKSRHRKYAAGPLEDVCVIPVEAFQPVAPPRSTVISGDHSTYLKSPNLSGFDGSDSLARQVLQELRACEIIRDSPHVNLVTFYGCSLAAGRVAGLYFRRYPGDLMTFVNPNHLNKSMLIESVERQPARNQAAGFLTGIENGVHYLHKLKLIHNDLNPANILITEDNTPIVCDFDSSSYPGADISHTKRTHGWHDPTVRVAQESNDLDALFELGIWLTGSTSAAYRFTE